MMRSRLLLGTVWHQRTHPVANAFTYRVLYLALDLDEMEMLDQHLWLFSRNRFNAYALNDRDHDGSGGGRSVRDAVRERLTAAGVSHDGKSIVMVTQPSVLGYVFNPVSFYMVIDAAGVVSHMLAEVHNRKGGRHMYDMPNDGRGGAMRYTARFAKEFYVSPFIDMHATYDFAYARRRGRIYFGFDEHGESKMVLRTSLNLAEHPLTNATLAKAMLTHPLTPQLTVARIYWQAIAKLRLRGVTFRRPLAVKEGR
ncbi:MAG: DUF1365 domain-containing protein [SAR202 cluster bacterium]|nr:DUF1365 domain-containing protein [SAR202 cluster bacterium]